MIGAESFLVQMKGGALAEGERERAIAWGHELAAALRRSVAA